MEFGITRLVFEERIFVPVPKEYFEAARAAKKNLVVALNIEEKLTMLLENYAEFEQEMLSATLNHVIFRPTGWSDFISQLHAFNRRLINLLTACRLYIDHIQHDLNAIYGADCEFGQNVRTRKSEEYDARLGYRVLEALRNYVQHRGLPIGGIQFSSSLDREVQPAQVNHSVTPSLNIRTIKEDGGFKAAVLKELEKIGKTVDLKPFVREYVEGIGRVHQLVRELLVTDLQKWEGIFSDVQQQFRAAGGNDLVGLSVVARDDELQVIEEVQILDDLVTRRKWLVTRTAVLTQYSRHVVSNVAKA